MLKCMMLLNGAEKLVFALLSLLVITRALLRLSADESGSSEKMKTLKVNFIKIRYYKVNDYLKDEMMRY